MTRKKAMWVATLISVAAFVVLNLLFLILGG